MNIKIFPIYHGTLHITTYSEKTIALVLDLRIFLPLKENKKMHSYIEAKNYIQTHPNFSPWDMKKIFSLLNSYISEMAKNGHDILKIHLIYPHNRFIPVAVAEQIKKFVHSAHKDVGCQVIKHQKYKKRGRN